MDEHTDRCPRRKAGMSFLVASRFVIFSGSFHSNQPTMKRLFFFFTTALVMTSCNNETHVASETSTAKFSWPANLQPPDALKKPKEFTVHGDTRMDEYYWMNDYFKKGPDSNTVVEYLNAENAYKDSMLAGTKAFQEKLFAEMKGRIKEKDESVPSLDNGYYYYSRTEEGKQYFKFCRKKGSLDAPEEVLLDVDEMAKGHNYYGAAGFSVSPDNKLLAFGVDTVSRRQYVIHIKNLETGEILPDKMVNTTAASAWANDNKTVFYAKNDPVTLRSYQIYKHVLGTSSDQDELVFEEEDETFYCYVYKSKSDDFLFIASRQTTTSSMNTSGRCAITSFQLVFSVALNLVLINLKFLASRFVVM